MKHPKNRTCSVCGKPTRNSNKLCGWHLGNHDPVPEHHVAKVRPCIRCRKAFESTWAGDRVCSRCRDLEERAEREGRLHESPLEPVYTPAAAELITG